MASNSQFTEMFLKWPLSKILVKFWSVHEQGSGKWGLLDYMNINKIKKNLKLLVRLWNNLIEMFLEWPFSELFLKFWSVNKYGISEWRLLALYRHKEILVNSFLKATKKKMARAISKNQVSDPGPSWPSCLTHYHTIPPFDALKINSYRKHCEKRKLLITSDFSFSHKIFYPIWYLFSILNTL